jgi:hypothetical protein
MVAIRKGLLGIQGEYWCKAVVQKLINVGVKSLGDFIASTTAINHLIVAGGHRQLYHTILEMMLKEVAELVFGLLVGPAVGPEPSDEL